MSTNTAAPESVANIHSPQPPKLFPNDASELQKESPSAGVSFSDMMSLSNVTESVGSKPQTTASGDAVVEDVEVKKPAPTAAPPSYKSHVPTAKSDGYDANCNIYVALLPLSVDDRRLATIFSRFGPIVSAKVMNDRHTGVSKGYGFVLFKTEEAASRAVNEMSGTLVEGHRIHVRWCHFDATPNVRATGYAVSTDTGALVVNTADTLCQRSGGAVATTTTPPSAAAQQAAPPLPRPMMPPPNTFAPLPNAPLPNTFAPPPPPPQAAPNPYPYGYPAPYYSAPPPTAGGYFTPYSPYGPYGYMPSYGPPPTSAPAPPTAPPTAGMGAAGPYAPSYAPQQYGPSYAAHYPYQSAMPMPSLPPLPPPTTYPPHGLMPPPLAPTQPTAASGAPVTNIAPPMQSVHPQSGYYMIPATGNNVPPPGAIFVPSPQKS